MAHPIITAPSKGLVESQGELATPNFHSAKVLNYLE